MVAVDAVLKVCDCPVIAVHELDSQQFWFEHHARPIKQQLQRLNSTQLCSCPVNW